MIKFTKTEYYQALIHHDLIMTQYLEMNKTPDIEYLRLHAKTKKPLLQLFVSTINLDDIEFRKLKLQPELETLIDELLFQVQTNKDLLTRKDLINKVSQN